MKAVRIHHHGGPEVLRYETVNRPEDRDNQVLVEIKASGMNHLDLWVRKGIPGIQLPMILGSDGAGIVHAVGKNVMDFKVGDEVVIQPLTYCGSCRFCHSGRENYCDHWGILGENQDGTQCDFIALEPRFIRRKPANLSFVEAAGFALTGQTAYAMLIRRAGIQAGETVFIWGAGSGVGSTAIQIAKGSGCTVITTGGTEEKLKLAKRLGADLTLNHYSDDIPREIKEFSEGRGVDVVLEHVGAATWKTSMRILGKGGRLVTCGATTGSGVEIDLRHLFYKQHSILGSTMGDVASFEACLKLVSEGTLQPVIDRTFPLAAVREAHEYLEQGRQVGKVILVPE
ncbi:MAG: zinc-binding dehydrogenase [Fidelibacterota bacterium]